MTPQAMDASLQAIVPRPEPYDIRESRPYRVHMRMVARYGQGRVALAGDAAHVNAPAGGMGLNGGLHDAFELAEALDSSLHGGRYEARLDRYDRRRRPVAAQRDHGAGRSQPRPDARTRPGPPARLARRSAGGHCGPGTPARPPAPHVHDRRAAPRRRGGVGRSWQEPPAGG